MYFTATLVVTLVVSASSLAAPNVHELTRRHHHAALARARAAAPEPVADPIPASAALTKRHLRKRCSARKTASAPSSTAASEASSSAAPAHPSAAVNVAPLPISMDTTTSSSSSTPHHTSSSLAPSHTSSVAIPESSSKPKGPPPPSGVDGYHSGIQSGDGTFYGTGLGACGIVNHDSDYIVAVSYKLFDNYPGYHVGNPNTNPVCGRKIRASRNGKSVVVTVDDRCAGCNKPGSLDFSPAAFRELADPSEGRVDITWVWA